MLNCQSKNDYFKNSKNLRISSFYIHFIEKSTDAILIFKGNKILYKFVQQNCLMQIKKI